MKDYVLKYQNGILKVSLLVLMLLCYFQQKEITKLKLEVVELKEIKK